MPKIQAAAYELFEVDIHSMTGAQQFPYHHKANDLIFGRIIGRQSFNYWMDSCSRVKFIIILNASTFFNPVNIFNSFNSVNAFNYSNQIFSIHLIQLNNGVESGKTQNRWLSWGILSIIFCWSVRTITSVKVPPRSTNTLSIISGLI